MATTTEDKGARILRRTASLKAKRQPNDNTTKECFDYTFPLRGSGFNSSTLDAQSGQSKQAQLTDGTATDASRTLASYVQGGMTPANSLWFGMEVSNASDEEKRWLSESSTLLWENIHGSNFDAAGFECCMDLVPAGWFVLYIDEDREKGGFAFEQWMLSSCYVASSKPGGKIDILHREFDLSAEQAVAAYGENNLSAEVVKLAKDKPDEKVCFVQAIYPRQIYAVGAMLAKNLPFESCTVETKSKKIVKESGYHEFPCCVPRWSMLPNSSYATGPVFDALPDIKMLNELKRMEFASLDLAVAGMWIAEDDGVLNPKTIKVGPRKIIVANSVDSMKPLSSGVDFNIGFSAEERLQAAIRKTLMADQLQPQDGPAMTATEIHARIALIRQLLGPMYARFQSEYLQHLVERCFGLAFRAGVFAPPPQSLIGREFTVKYLSPLARAQKLEEVSAIDQHMQGVQAAAQAQIAAGEPPEALDNVDFDAAVKFRGEALGIPAKVQRSPDDIAAIRQARAQRQQDAAQQQQMQPMMQAAGQAVAKRVVGGA